MTTKTLFYILRADPGEFYNKTANMKTVKIIVEKHIDGYVAYPVGVEGVVVGQGDTFEEALQDVKSAIKFHIETFGQTEFDAEITAIDAFVAETTV